MLARHRDIDRAALRLIAAIRISVVAEPIAGAAPAVGALVYGPARQLAAELWIRAGTKHAAQGNPPACSAKSGLRCRPDSRRDTQSQRTTFQRSAAVR